MGESKISISDKYLKIDEAQEEHLNNNIVKL